MQVVKCYCTFCNQLIEITIENTKSGGKKMSLLHDSPNCGLVFEDQLLDLLKGNLRRRAIPFTVQNVQPAEPYVESWKDSMQLYGDDPE